MNSLIIDIGSDSVGITLSSNDKQEIVSSVRVNISASAISNFERFEKATIKALEQSLIILEKNGIGAVSKISCFLQAPWCITKTHIISLNKKTPFTFNKNLSTELIERELDLFKKNELGCADLTDPNSGILRLFELQVTNTKLNGYTVVDPLGKQARQVEMSIFTSIAPRDFLNNIEQAVSRHIANPNILFRSFLFASSVVAQSFFPDNQPFITVYVGGEISEVAIVAAGRPTESISFPSGYAKLIRELATETNRTPEETRSLLEVSMSGIMHSAEVQAWQDVKQKISQNWLNYFQDVISKISLDGVLPARIILFTATEHTAWFSEIIRQEKNNQYTTTESKFKVLPFSKSILNIYDPSGASANIISGISDDLFLSMEALFLVSSVNKKEDSIKYAQKNTRHSTT